MSKQSLYKILELNDGASIPEVKKAFRRLSFKYHPDSNKGNKSSVDKFILIDNAYNILSDPISKAEYDRSLINTQWKESISKKHKNPQYENRRTYSTEESQSEGNWQDWRNLKNQHPVISMIFCYIMIVMLVIVTLLPNSKKNRSNNLFAKHTQYTNATQNQQQQEEQSANCTEITEDKAMQVYESFDYPKVFENNIPQLYLYNVELTGSETILSFMYKNLDSKMISVTNNIHLVGRMYKDNNIVIRQYELLRAEGIPVFPQRYILSESDSLFFFRLVFDAIPNTLRYFNMVESRSDTKPFNIRGIDLDQKDEDMKNKFEEKKIKLSLLINPIIYYKNLYDIQLSTDI